MTKTARRRGGRAGGAPPPDPQEQGSEPDPDDIARSIVLRQLTMAPRSRAQLEEALRKRSCSDEVAARVLDRMTEVGLVDDVAYANMLVRSKQAERGLARRALHHELRAKGVDDDIIAEALETVDPETERARAEELVAKKLRTMAGLDPLVQSRRLAGMLARKGYSSSVAYAVVRDAVNAAPEHQRD